MIIRAKQKPIEQLPGWALCCEATRTAHAKEDNIGRIVKVNSKSVFVGESECGVCHHITKDIRFAHVAGESYAVIAIELFDLDEGGEL